MPEEKIIVLGLNHHAPVEVREKLAFERSALGESLKRLHSLSAVREGVILSTCNRLEDKAVMLIGAGKMGSLVVRYLQSSGVRSLMVTNRTFERAVELAEEFQGNPIRYEDFPRYLQMADVGIGSSGSPQILLRSETVRDALKERRQKAMFLIDLGVPRNFDPRIDEIDNAYLYNIDNLKDAGG